MIDVYSITCLHGKGHMGVLGVSVTAYMGISM